MVAEEGEGRESPIEQDDSAADLAGSATRFVVLQDCLFLSC